MENLELSNSEGNACNRNHSLPSKAAPFISQLLPIWMWWLISSIQDSLPHPLLPSTFPLIILNGNPLCLSRWQINFTILLSRTLINFLFLLISSNIIKFDLFLFFVSLLQISIRRLLNNLRLFNEETNSNFELHLPAPTVFNSSSVFAVLCISISCMLHTHMKGRTQNFPEVIYYLSSNYYIQYNCLKHDIFLLYGTCMI